MIILSTLLLIALAQHAAMPPGITHEEHLAQMRKEAELKQRGEAAMGFDQDAVAHHFTLTSDGGAIEVGVKDPRDRTNLAAIRAHLETIAKAFAEGRFDAPFATHGEIPPGVPDLQRLKDVIRYRFESTATGGRVRITSTSREAVTAAHAFLRYQIREHRTGDPG